jgi:hypothetical protein
MRALTGASSNVRAQGNAPHSPKARKEPFMGYWEALSEAYDSFEEKTSRTVDTLLESQGPFGPTMDRGERSALFQAMEDVHAIVVGLLNREDLAREDLEAAVKRIQELKKRSMEESARLNWDSWPAGLLGDAERMLRKVLGHTSDDPTLP